MDVIVIIIIFARDRIILVSFQKSVFSMIITQNIPTAYLMVGIPGAGKSTWIANNLPSDIPIISRDMIRVELGFTTSVNEKKSCHTCKSKK